MPWRLYLIPIIGDGSKNDPRRPKYIESVTSSWAMMDYGMQPAALVAADVDLTGNTFLAAQADVFRFPLDLDQQVGALGAPVVQQTLEKIPVPGDWVTPTTTWRQVVRTLIACCLFLQRYAHLAQDVRPLLDGTTVKLDTPVSALPTKVLGTFGKAAIEMAIDTTTVDAAATVRDVWRSVKTRWELEQFQLGGVLV